MGKTSFELQSCTNPAWIETVLSDFDAFLSTDVDRFDSFVLFEGGYTDDNYGTERPYILNKGFIQ